MLFQGKNDVFLRDTGSKYLVTNAIMTELKKAGCNAFHLYDDTVKLSC